MRRRHLPVSGLLVFLSFVAVALVQSWPLPLHLSTRLTGEPGGDTGVYVWNTWVFSHELLEKRSWPFSTEAVLGLDGPTDLSLHNYTVASDLLAVPLQPWLGVVASFNIVYLVNVALAGLGMFLLARHVWRPAGITTGEAWLAGLLFACSPFLVARSTAHFSLVAAAPLPFFALCFDRAWQRGSTRDAGAAGACLAWAAYCDPYYAIYCLLIATVLMAARLLSVSIEPRRPFPRWAPAFDLPILAIALVIVVSIASAGLIVIGPLSISLRTLYTPVLLITTLVVLRLLWTLRPRARVAWPPSAMLVHGAVMTVVATTLLAPLLYAVARRAVDGQMVQAPVLWRSSAPGIDLLSLVAPNPNHPLAPAWLVRWTAAQPGQYEENVASIPWVALMVIAVAWTRASYRPHRAWTAAGFFFAALALGPFIRVGGIQTYVPTPWTLLRYIPILGEARMPARFSVLVILSVGVVFAGALAALGRRAPARRRAALVALSVLLAAELLPAPRRLYSAEVPTLFETIARDGRAARVLTLPFGIRDGLSSLGNFSALSLYFQTTHDKPLVGGYLSRVSRPTKDHYLAEPTIAALLAWSEGCELTPEQRAAAAAGAAAFVRREQIGWVVIDDSLAHHALRAFAIDLLHLRLREQHERFALFEVPEPEG